jgi:hypothetical protein
VSQPKGSRIPTARLNPPHAAKAMHSNVMFADRLSGSWRIRSRSPHSAVSTERRYASFANRGAELRIGRKAGRLGLARDRATQYYAAIVESSDHAILAVWFRHEYPSVAATGGRNVTANNRLCAKSFCFWRWTIASRNLFALAISVLSLSGRSAGSVPELIRSARWQSGANLGTN